MKDYPKQHFAVVSGNLRCNACSKTLSLKKSSIDKHIKSSNADKWSCSHWVEDLALSFTGG